MTESPLRQWRMWRGWTLEAMAHAISPDLQPSVLSKWERGVTVPTLRYAARILAVTQGRKGLKIVDLLSGSES